MKEQLIWGKLIMFIKVTKAAKMLDVHRDTILNYIKRGTIKGRQLPGGHWRVEESSVSAILNKPIDQEAAEIVAGLF
ncbi:MAG: helix-turn-helix domain-containing protein [Desulfobacteraceae bacterium]|nr:helix-turn-helix domain-containing protein [Desulfobacteraceae bacterium]